MNKAFYIYTFPTSEFWHLAPISNALSLHVNCQLLIFLNIMSHLIPKAPFHHAKPSPSLLKTLLVLDGVFGSKKLCWFGILLQWKARQSLL